MLHARRKVDCLSKKNTCLLTKNENILPVLSTQNAYGCRPHEHAVFFLGDDQELHNLIRKYMLIPFITCDFFPGHLEEVTRGKYFAFQNPNAGGTPVNMRGIVIGSTMTWRCCAVSYSR